MLGMNSAQVDVVAMHRALCAPAVPGVCLFSGATELLAAALWGLWLRRVILSNLQVRGALEYWRDFCDLGIGYLVDAVVTSLTSASTSASVR